jgi:anti-sigma-K factor RskA
LDSQRIIASEGRIAGSIVSEHDQFRELIEAHALGSLDEQEHAAFDAHLAAGCTDCAKALAEARWLVTQLVYLAPPAEPSEMLRARVLQKVRAEAGTATAQAQTARPSKTAVPLWLWAGVAALLVFSVYSTWRARQLEGNIQALVGVLDDQAKQNKNLLQELVAAKHEAHILTDPASKKFTIWPSDKEMPKLEAAWHPAMGIYVTGQQVPMPSGNRVLQLWLIPKAPGGKPMPSHTFWPDAKGKVDLMVSDPPEVMAETKALAITEEPAGGSAQPTSTPMWVGGVS